VSRNAPGANVVVVTPAYNAGRTLAKTLRAVPEGWVDEFIVVDDGSHDDTSDRARALGVTLERHPTNRGYGAAQKTGYAAALARGADVVVLLHSDNQYEPTLLPRFVEPIASGQVDALTGSRIKSGDALKGGMPLWKYVPNRVLTWLGNTTFGLSVSEYHNGYRAYRRAVLEAVPFASFSDRFDFDTQILVHLSVRGFRLGEVPSPTRFNDESSKMSFRQGIVYGTSLLRHMAAFAAHRFGLRRDPTLP
jgi:glycosyltransferase involved in cell wall biosynthesis